MIFTIAPIAIMLGDGDPLIGQRGHQQRVLVDLEFISEFGKAQPQLMCVAMIGYRQVAAQPTA